MVELRSGKSTTPYTKAQEEQAAAVLQERKEKETKKELIRQAKKLALQEEHAAKRKKLEEEMERLKKEEEEKMKAVEEEEIEEEEEEEEEPLIRRSAGQRGESSGPKKEDSWMEKKVSEWVANLSLGEEEEAMLYVPREEKSARGSRKQKKYVNDVNDDQVEPYPGDHSSVLPTKNFKIEWAEASHLKRLQQLEEFFSTARKYHSNHLRATLDRLNDVRKHACSVPAIAAEARECAIKDAFLCSLHELQSLTTANTVWTRAEERAMRSKRALELQKVDLSPPEYLSSGLVSKAKHPDNQESIRLDYVPYAIDAFLCDQKGFDPLGIIIIVEAARWIARGCKTLRELIVTLCQRLSSLNYVADRKRHPHVLPILRFLQQGSTMSPRELQTLEHRFGLVPKVKRHWESIVDCSKAMGMKGERAGGAGGGRQRGGGEERGESEQEEEDKEEEERKEEKEKGETKLMLD
ncbi:hypothetical protein CBR_g4108 [Chara braunii]|uniref:Uncharacterized protein n=1 Tax=Chara braunii TaxID=69332 RepID=A0A388KHG4_CHABU|nr:hypothetical protein CBR_g4108 [Chara braunii]|eukprot:GBG69413.1 hypothetical protein CBR_g4108 [Chara braunii]